MCRHGGNRHGSRDDYSCVDMDQRPPLRLAGSGGTVGPGALRWVLFLVAVLQILLGAAQIIGIRAVDLVNGGHVGNESAAWNIALGAAFLGVARAGRCPSGVLVMIAAFIGVLTVLTVSDLLSGRVGVARIGTHALLITGFVPVLRLSRRAGPPATPDRAGTSAKWITTNAGQTPSTIGHHANSPDPRLPAAYPRGRRAGRRPDHTGPRRLR